MAKQSFVTGQVLTAAQLTSLQQTAMSGGAASAKTANYTLVAADAGTAISMTSTSATTITVNTGLFAAGDTVFIQNLGTANCTITAGTATVNTAGSLILPQYDAGILYFVSASSAVFYDYIQAPAGGGGWTSLATGSLSGTSTSVNITTTGYYQVVVFVKNVTCTGDFYMGFDLNTDSGSNYSFINQYTTNGGTTVVAATSRSATTSIFVDQPFQFDANAYATFVINDPANTNAHKIISGIAAGTHYDNSYNLSGQFLGRYMSNSAITNIRFQPASTFSTGTYEIYGVK